MKSEHWKRAKQILPKVRELPREEERAAFLDEACGDDLELRQEIESFLATDPAALTFMDKPPIKILGEALGGGNDPLQEDSQVGAYRILRQLGSGGMGIVYLAARVGDEFTREVAIKVLLKDQAGQASEEAEQRFLQEMGILAKLNHPNIAKLHEGGRTEDGGRLYYLMEYVEGKRIDVYCREHKLSLEDRLRLFQKVCEAVQYAHTQLIIHRDIKPSNVLVTAEGEPKLLDFGVAKPLAGAAGAGVGTTVLTGGDQKLYTPDYASPEQIAGQDIHTASDVYSLGILLYELLAGDRPYRLKKLAEKEIQRIVCEQTPVPPSTALAETSNSEASEEPPATDSTTASFRRKLEGDLDTIVLMALRKAPRERYATVQRLADDIENHLAGHPIDAREPSFRYKARKFVRRNRIGLGIAGLFVLVIGIAAWALFNQYGETVQQRDRAEAVSEFLGEVFSHSDPQTKNTPDTTARELLDQAVRQIETRLGQAPATKASLLVSLGASHLNLGLYDRASEILEQAVGLSRQHAPRSELMGDALQALGALRLHIGENEKARDLLLEALDLRKKTLGSQAEKTATCHNVLGLVYKRLGEYEQAEAAYRAALDIRRLNTSDQVPLARSLQNLGALMRTLNRYPEAEKLYAEAIEIKSRSLGADHPSTATTVHNLGRLYKDQGRYDASEQQYRRAIEINRRSLGGLHPEVAKGLDTLGTLLLKVGRIDEAEARHIEALEIRREVLGENHPDIARSLNNLGADKYARGELQAAESLYREAVEISSRASGQQHHRTLHYKASLAVALEMQGRLGDAEQMLLSCLKAHQAKKSVNWREVARLKRNMAILLAKTDRLEETERFARESLDEFSSLLGGEHPETANSASVLGGVLLLARRLDEAEPLLRSSYAILLESQGAEAAATTEALKRLEALERLSNKQRR